jgi:hypothetical protein
VHLVWFIIRIYHDERSSKCQIILCSTVTYPAARGVQWHWGYRGQSDCEVFVNTYNHEVGTLRMRVAKPPLRLNALVHW